MILDPEKQYKRASYGDWHSDEDSLISITREMSGNSIDSGRRQVCTEFI